MSVYVCPGIRLMADGRRRAQSVSNMASCVCPGMYRSQDTARSCCFPTILFSFACRGIQDAHADRNNVPVSHTSRHAYRDQSHCLSSSPALRHAPTMRLMRPPICAMTCICMPLDATLPGRATRRETVGTARFSA